MANGFSNRAASRLLVFLILLVALSGTVQTAAIPGEKMKPEEILAKHLESIGSAEARAAAHNRIINGTAMLTVRQGGRGVAEGRSLLASEGVKNLLMLTFASPDYPEEKLAFNGKKLTAKTFRAGTATPLGQFFLSNDLFFNEGLIGGTLSSAWPLLDLAERKAKLEFAGTEKINNRPVYKVRYNPRKGSEFKVTLFFDAETFQHVRTEYDRSIAATMGATPMSSAAQGETRMKVIEEFSDFKAETGLTLPHSYKLEIQIQSRTNPFLMDTTFSLNEFLFNQSMKPADFEANS